MVRPAPASSVLIDRCRGTHKACRPLLHDPSTPPSPVAHTGSRCWPVVMGRGGGGSLLLFSRTTRRICFMPNPCHGCCSTALCWLLCDLALTLS
jgi:hypothetical protein